MTQGDLAVQCGWVEDPVEGQSRISNYERNERQPTLGDIIKIAEILKVDAAQLAFGNPLTPDETEEQIIRTYRQATPDGRKFILKACEAAQPERRQNKPYKKKFGK
jgi:transcriptional regulator with XRE-family HTH domain